MTNSAINDETRLNLMKVLEENPEISQRELANELGVSLGKVNYCLKALIEIGWVKAGNFARSKNKMGYAYVLTPEGIKEKAAITLRFLEFKQKQYKQLKSEIEQLRKEVGQ